MEFLKNINRCFFLLLLFSFFQSDALIPAAFGKTPKIKKRPSKSNNFKKAVKFSFDYQPNEYTKLISYFPALKYEKWNVERLNVAGILKVPQNSGGITQTIFIYSLIFASIVLVWRFLIIIADKTTALIKAPPGIFILKIADLLPKKQCEILKQEISDMLSEHYEALKENDMWKARRVVIYYYIGLSWSIVMWLSNKIKEVIGIIPKKN